MTKRSRPLGALAIPLLMGAIVAGCATTSSMPPVPVPSGAVATGAVPTGASAPGSVDISNGGSGLVSSETMVCTFYFHFVLNANSSGTYRVETQRGGKVVMTGTWATGAAAEVRVPAAPNILSLPESQYNVYWTQDGGGGGAKPFQVACPDAS
jgi:hypothetical protein